jgi:hypothetical protein
MSNGVEEKRQAENDESSENSEEDLDQSSKRTDEDLFKMCGGRTAHK